MKLQRSLLLVVLIGLIFTTGPVMGVQAQQGTDSRYFEETGHWVTGDFYRYYSSFAEAEFIFGYPLTEAYTDSASGRTVQYFQRARFELYPERPSGERVQPTPLGGLLYSPGPTLNLSNLLSCRTFSETGFSVCYAFLDFFEKFGGEAAFGYPISGFEFYNGRIVQYFERARFEWYPELSEGQKVVLANLGRIYFDQADEDPALLNPVENSLVPATVLELRTRVFTWKPTTRRNDIQRVYVVVQDQALRPVPGASGMLTISWPGSTETIRFETDKNGVSVINIPVTNQPHGELVTVTADVVYRGLGGRAVTSFRVWR